MNRTEDYLFLEARNINSSECIMFDFDGTLCVKANSDRPYTQENNENNFVFLYNVEKRIFSYISRGFLIAIVSNQSYMTSSKEQMMLRIYNHFEQKISIYIANKQNRFRKPNTGFYELLSERYKVLYHCGDAVGNTSDFPPFKYASTDLDFANICNIPFYSSLEIFGSNFYTVVPKQRLVIMMGIQGSGKTTIAKRLEEENGFVRFSQDEVGYLPNKLNKISNALRNSQVVVDATHRNNNLRQKFINLCSDYIILWCVRDGRVFNKLREKPIDHKAFARYVNEFEAPTENYIIVS